MIKKHLTDTVALCINNIEHLPFEYAQNATIKKIPTSTSTRHQALTTNLSLCIQKNTCISLSKRKTQESIQDIDMSNILTLNELNLWLNNNKPKILVKIDNSQCSDEIKNPVDQSQIILMILEKILILSTNDSSQRNLGDLTQYTHISSLLQWISESGYLYKIPIEIAGRAIFFICDICHIMPSNPGANPMIRSISLTIKNILHHKDQRKILTSEYTDKMNCKFSLLTYSRFIRCLYHTFLDPSSDRVIEKQESLQLILLALQTITSTHTSDLFTNNQSDYIQIISSLYTIQKTVSTQALQQFIPQLSELLQRFQQEISKNIISVEQNTSQLTDHLSIYLDSFDFILQYYLEHTITDKYLFQSFHTIYQIIYITYDHADVQPIYAQAHKILITLESITPPILSTIKIDAINITQAEVKRTGSVADCRDITVSSWETKMKTCTNFQNIDDLMKYYSVNLKDLSVSEFAHYTLCLVQLLDKTKDMAYDINHISIQEKAINLFSLLQNDERFQQIECSIFIDIMTAISEVYYIIKNQSHIGILHILIKFSQYILSTFNSVETDIMIQDEGKTHNLVAFYIASSKVIANSVIRLLYYHKIILEKPASLDSFDNEIARNIKHHKNTMLQGLVVILKSFSSIRHGAGNNTFNIINQSATMFKTIKSVIRLFNNKSTSHYQLQIQKKLLIILNYSSQLFLVTKNQKIIFYDRYASAYFRIIQLMAIKHLKDLPAISLTSINTLHDMVKDVLNKKAQFNKINRSCVFYMFNLLTITPISYFSVEHQKKIIACKYIWLQEAQAILNEDKTQFSTHESREFFIQSFIIIKELLYIKKIKTEEISIILSIMLLSIAHHKLTINLKRQIFKQLIKIKTKITNHQNLKVKVLETLHNLEMEINPHHKKTVS
ncbi:MAG: hypothetical protein HAW62_02050 [Endozoicomonadaceae bacterium]|nr:hypothetical protein [Endozoicomonadaceae bacterium]